MSQMSLARLLSPNLLARHHQLYSDLAADIVMGSYRH
jgi:hypothetical protein